MRGGACHQNITAVMWSHEDLHMTMILSVTRGPACGYSFTVGVKNTSDTSTFNSTADFSQLEPLTTLPQSVVQLNLSAIWDQHAQLHNWMSHWGPCNVDHVRTPVTQNGHVLTHKLPFPVLCFSAH